MKKMMCMFLVFSICFSLTGCDRGISARDLMDDVKPLPTPVYSGMSSEMSGAQMHFSIELFKNCVNAEKGKNLLISPLSVYVALAMTANGAENETKREISALLGAETKELNPYLKDYIGSLPNRKEGKTLLANSVWFRNDKNRLRIEESFLQTNADYFGAQVYASPFDNTTAKDINNWVKRNTNGMIEKIVDKISPDTVMYLINALAFEADWDEAYEKYQVRDTTFNCYSGEKRQASLMYSNEGFLMKSDDALGFKKNYKNSDYGFVAILPNEGIDIYSFIKNGGIEKILQNANEIKGGIVYAGIPKFSYEYSLTMNDTLKAMGMPSAFDSGKADFRNMATSSRGNIYIGDVVHKTFIEVGEKGTKAGAVTKVEMNDEAAMIIEDQKEVILDRPFIYMIVDNKSDLPLFIGLAAQIGN